MDKTNKGGRFTGWQITTMVVATVFLVVALPFSVAAATGSLINIADPVTASRKARVTSQGSLAVTLRDATTGAQAKVDSNGRLLADSTYAAPASAFSVTVGGSSAADTTLQTLVPGFTSGKLMITSFSIANNDVSTTFASISRYTDGTCSTGAGFYLYIVAKVGDSASASFPTPVIVTQPCAILHFGGLPLVTITGYRVP